MRSNSPYFLTIDRAEQCLIVEALIFAASTDENLSAENILNLVLYDEKQHISNLQTDENENNSILAAQSLDSTDTPATFTIADIDRIVAEINLNLETTKRPYRIVNFAGSYQFATIPQFGKFVERMLTAKTKKRFSAAQLETLAIIAYKQPVTKQEIDRIRGVMSSSEILNVLIEKELVKIAGRKEVLGKPLLYATTSDFLRTFGLNNITELPKLREIEEIAEQKLKEEEECTDLVLNVTEEDIENLRTSNFIETTED